MCIARVGKVLSISEGRARVRFFDQRETSDVDLTAAGGAKKGSFVEVYGNLALSVLTPAEAHRRLAAWKEIRRAALMPLVGRKGR